MHRHSRTIPRHRAAFTLIELIIVILIIAILTSLLLVAVNSAIARARIAGVVTEISSFEKAIADFKLEYGSEPPSYFVLHEDGSHWAGSADDERWSRQIVRKFWPQFLDASNLPTSGDDFDGDGSPDDVVGSDGIYDFDFNRDGDADDDFVLNGGECLVFFLGGRWNFTDADGDGLYDAGEQVFLTGFSSNPVNPFQLSGTQSNRIQFYDFDPDRLVDIDGDRMAEFIDELPNQDMPYQYFSSYEGAGYRPYGQDDTRNTADDESLGTDSDGDSFQDTIVGPEAEYYSSFSPRNSYESKAFQIISPGYDREFFPDDQRPGAANARSSPPGFGYYDGEAAESLVERDNITNFKGGQLN